MAAFSVSEFYIQSVGLLGGGISPMQGHYLHKEQQKTHKDTHATNGIQTHDPCVRAGEDGS
jgi:hypothetical protein